MSIRTIRRESCHHGNDNRTIFTQITRDTHLEKCRTDRIDIIGTSRTTRLLTIVSTKTANNGLSALENRRDIGKNLRNLSDDQ